MEDWKGRVVQDTGRTRLRPSRSSAVPATDQYSKGSAARGNADRPSYRTLSASIQVEAAPGKRAGSKGHRRKASGAGAARPTSQKRKTNLAAAVSPVQGRNVGGSTAAARRNGKRSSARNKTRMGPARVRGGATHPCPECESVTRVLRTTKVGNTVERHRQCQHCHHEYHTTEHQ